MAGLELRFPRLVRWCHWLNVPLLGLMIWSGLLIYWANSVYAIRLGPVTIVRFFPRWFYEALNVPYRLAEGLSLHFTAMWLFALNGLVYAVVLGWTGHRRAMRPHRTAIQRIAYTVVLLMAAGSLLTGIAIYKPIQASGLCALLGGYEAARQVHFLLTLGFAAFIVGHLVQVIRAGWATFLSMVCGYVRIPAPLPPEGPAP